MASLSESELFIVVCPDCDLVLERHALRPNAVASCPRCGSQLYRTKPQMLDLTLAYSLTGLFFFIPANTLPVLTFSILGKFSTNTMLNGVEQLFGAGYWWMSFLVLMCSVVVPLIELLLLAAISIALKTRRFVKAAGKMMLLHSKISEWSLLEVYLLGILIAYIKMIDLGNVIPGVGLLCFVLMLAASVLARQAFDVETGFDILEKKTDELCLEK